jgi:Rrf2 family protein
MQLGEGIEWAVHCASILALVPPDRTMTAAKLAEFHQVPPAYLAKHLQALAQAGIVESVAGRKGGYRLAKPATEISVLDVVHALGGGEPTFVCTEIRRRGPAAMPAKHYAAPCGIHAVMDRADAAWRAELARTSILDLVMHVAETASPVAIRKTTDWFVTAMR